MEKRISKSFRTIFGRLYPNFDENETQNSEEYFNFILKNYPDKSEVIQLKAFFVIFSFGLRKLFIKDRNIPKYINNLQSSNISLFRKLGSGMTALFGLSTARSLNGEGSVYKHFDYMSGVSFLPFSEHTYTQAPYQDIQKDEYELLIKKMPTEVEWSKLSEYEKTDMTIASQELACSAGFCEIA